MKTAWQTVAAARSLTRPTSLRYIEALFPDFMEFHGDRRFGDDPAVIGGIATFGGKPITVIALEKGDNTKNRIARNFGSANPEGYRKALRLMKQAEKFGRPVLCLVDTSGAYCGIGAEERGQGQAIAENLLEMMQLRTPILSILIGEGGSGGALALAVADEVWMLENAIYSVISPEGCASILWKDSSQMQRAAEVLKLTAQDLMGFGVIERIIAESEGFEEDPSLVFEDLRQKIAATFDILSAQDKEVLLDNRYARFRKLGPFQGEGNI